MSLTTRRVIINELRDWIQRAEKALRALEDMEEAGVTPKGKTTLPQSIKTCTKCGKTKPVMDFSCRGTRARCKECVNQYLREWYQQNAAGAKHQCKKCGAKFRALNTLIEHEKMRHTL